MTTDLSGDSRPERGSGSWFTAMTRAWRANPSLRLLVGLFVTLATISGFTLYTIREVRNLRDEQTAISERNRLDSLQLLRIQNNLSEIALSMRDMADGAEPYERIYWRQTFDRRRTDLDQAIEAERALAPAERPAAQQERLHSAVTRFWETMDAVFAETAAGRDDRAVTLLRTTASSQHQELVSLVSQLLVLNNLVQQDALQRNRDIYGRVEGEIFTLMGALLLIVVVGGVMVIGANRRAFDDVQRMSGQLRSLSWRMMRMQEDLQESFSRELHDEFGQLLTAIGMLLGRVKRRLPSDSPLVADLEEVRGIVQQTLDKIRTESRLLHPVVLDDFGLEKALQWYVEQFGRQHGINARYLKSGPIGVISPEATIHIYRIVQEALTNVSRHSGSTDAWVRLRQADDRIELEIEDRGKGLPPEADRGNTWEGIGLVSMRERTQLMGGSFALRPAEGGGLIVSVQVPLRMAARAVAVPEDHEEEARIG
jgi:signal transduction histidine kinase